MARAILASGTRDTASQPTGFFNDVGDFLKGARKSGGRIWVLAREQRTDLLRQAMFGLAVNDRS